MCRPTELPAAVDNAAVLQRLQERLQQQLQQNGAPLNCGVTLNPLAAAQCGLGASGDPMGLQHSAARGSGPRLFIGHVPPVNSLGERAAGLEGPPLES